MVRIVDPARYAVFAAAAFAWCVPSCAATIAVDSLDTAFNASTACSIARAVSYLNAGEATDNHDYCAAVGPYGVDDKIIFALGAGTPAIVVTRSGAAAYLEIPDITKPMTIDGATGGATRVELSGGSGVTAPALRVRAPNVTIRNLVIHGFPLAQIDVGAVDGVTIRGNYLGTDSSGALPTSGNKNGLRLVGATHALVGGPDAAARNVIAGNTLVGIDISDHAGDIRIQGNYIGTAADGVTALGNCGDGTWAACGGIAVREGAHDVAIGSANGGNVISGNHGNGIVVAGTGLLGDDPYDTTIEGNRIGVGADDSTPLGNGGTVAANGDCGVKMLLNTDIVESRIGGTSLGSGNVIANNAYCGVLVEGGNFTTIEGNREYGNGTIGTDLSLDIAGDGPTDNDRNGHLAGANLFQDFPVLTDAVTTAGNRLYVSGTLQSPNTPDEAAVRIEVFANPAGETQGRYFVGSFDIRTDASGTGRFADQGPFVIPAGSPDISLTATTENGTSEMSATLGASSMNDVIFANSFDAR